MTAASRPDARVGQGAAELAADAKHLQHQVQRPLSWSVLFHFTLVLCVWHGCLTCSKVLDRKTQAQPLLQHDSACLGRMTKRELSCQ